MTRLVGLCACWFAAMAVSCADLGQADGSTSELPNALARVVLSDGRPVAAAKVYLRPADYRPALSLEGVEIARRNPNLRTARNGSLAIAVPAPGWWTLEVDADSQATVKTFHVESRDIALGTLSLTRKSALSATVRVPGDSSGGWAFIPGQERLAYFDENGRLDMRGVPSGPVRLAILSKRQIAKTALSVPVTLVAGEALQLGQLNSPPADVLDPVLQPVVVDNFEDGDLIPFQAYAWRFNSDSARGGNTEITSVAQGGGPGIEIRNDDPPDGRHAFFSCRFGDAFSEDMTGYCNMGIRFADPGTGADLRKLEAIMFRYKATRPVWTHWLFLDTAHPDSWYGKVSRTLPARTSWTWARIAMDSMVAEAGSPVGLAGLGWSDLSDRATMFNLEMGGGKGDSAKLWLDDFILEWSP